MKEELIFHLVSRSAWKEGQQEGRYRPEIYEQEGYIPCADGRQIQVTANQKFKDSLELLLLVIDPTRVNTRVAYEYDQQVEQKVPRVYGPLNIDAVIDKIELEADQDGEFKIEVESN